MSVHEKTITVAHPEAHSAPERALKAAVKADEEIGDGWTVKSSVNESGKQTDYVITWSDDGDDPAAPADPAPPAADDQTDGTPESSDPARKASKRPARPGDAPA